MLGALWSPDDGQINPVDATTVVAAAAKRSGVKIFEHTPVVQILKDDEGRVCGVQTPSGTIAAETVLLACGMWTRQIAGDAGAVAPLWPCEHEYFLTEAIPEAADLPVVRSYDEHLYLKHDAGKVVATRPLTLGARCASPFAALCSAAFPHPPTHPPTLLFHVCSHIHTLPRLFSSLHSLRFGPFVSNSWSLPPCRPPAEWATEPVD